jgi:myo-inositol-1(or 4)-monophosphatase
MSYLELAKSAAASAGEWLKRRSNLSVDSEEAHDTKLAADKEAETIIIKALSPSKLPMLAEESGAAGNISGLHWIIDPLDGTVNYLRGISELSSVSIALFDGNEPFLGVINRFAANGVFAGVVGQGATLNDERIRPSSVTKLGNAILATGFPNKFNYSSGGIAKFASAVQRVKKVRMLGSAALMGAFVSCGYVDAYLEEGIRIWDIAAAMAIVKSSGGSVHFKPHSDDPLFRCDFGAFATKDLMEAYLA